MKKVFLLTAIIFCSLLSFSQSKFDATVALSYVPDGGELAAANFGFQAQLGYQLSGIELNAGLLTDAKVTTSSIYVGSEMSLIKVEKATFKTFGAIGTTISEDKVAFVNYGLAVSYQITPVWSVVSQVKSTYHYSQASQTSMSAGVNIKF